MSLPGAPITAEHIDVLAHALAVPFPPEDLEPVAHALAAHCAFVRPLLERTRDEHAREHG